MWKDGRIVMFATGKKPSKAKGALARFWQELKDFPSSGDERSAPEETAAEAWLGGRLNRRDFLGVLEASMALAGITGCTAQPPEFLVPAAKSREDRILTAPTYFATTYLHHGYGIGILAESHLGRPTKIEGNPNHPSSLGAASAAMQASLLELYDPDRSQSVRCQGATKSWNDFLQALNNRMKNPETFRLRILSEHISSPSALNLMRTIKKRFPLFEWHSYDPTDSEYRNLALQRVFDRPCRPDYQFAKAKRILVFDSDPLGEGADALRLAREFAEGRRVSATQAMNRLYAVEPSFTLTGGMADERLVLGAEGLASSLYFCAELCGISVPKGPYALKKTDKDWLTTAMEDLLAHKGESLVVAGDHLSVESQALALLINEKLEAYSETILLREEDPYDRGAKDIKALMAALNAGEVDGLVLLGGNPLYTLPKDLAFDQALAKVPLSVHWSLYADETSARCQWHLPMAHSLESWGDARSMNGTVSFVQPLITPLYQGRTLIEVLGLIADGQEKNGLLRMQDYWKTRFGPKDFEGMWKKTLREGILAGSEAKVIERPLKNLSLPARPPALDRSLSVIFRTDPTIDDGRFGNNAWLQELPKPFSQITWGNALIVGPGFARSRGLKSGDHIRLEKGPRFLEAPVFVQAGQADDTVVATLGYGRTHAGRVGNHHGYDTAGLRSLEEFWLVENVTVKALKGKSRFARRQRYMDPGAADPVKVYDYDFYQKFPDQVHHDLNPYPQQPNILKPSPLMNAVDESDKPAWSMTIDLNTCIGCNACMIACQAENNIPVVGKEQVALGREMHWIRVDTYYEGHEENPRAVHQPVPCMHCEQAPCESVCPVGATVHSEEGLNQMVYNRCVGTRYCSNNCPYKVRRFNFLDYGQGDDPHLALMQNPDVTVRSRGVMEKCTYCVQRIRASEIEEKKTRSDGVRGRLAFETACQQTCPVKAIVFGNRNDPKAEVAQTAKSPLRYDLLGALNTKPRTGYLAKFINRRKGVQG